MIESLHKFYDLHLPWIKRVRKADSNTTRHSYKFGNMKSKELTHSKTDFIPDCPFS